MEPLIRSSWSLEMKKIFCGQSVQYRARKQAADSSVGRLLTRAVLYRKNDAKTPEAHFCWLVTFPYLKIAPLVPTTHPQSGAAKNNLKRFARAPSSTFSHVAPPSVVCSKSPRSPAIQPSLGPSLGPSAGLSFAFGKTTSLRFSSTPEVCRRHRAPPFAVEMIVPFAPTAQPRCGSTK